MLSNNNKKHLLRMIKKEKSKDKSISFGEKSFISESARFETAIASTNSDMLVLKR